MKEQAIELIQQWLEGLITCGEVTQQLERWNIRGAFGLRNYCGYDYTNQQWIEIDY